MPRLIEYVFSYLGFDLEIQSSAHGATSIFIREQPILHTRSFRYPALQKLLYFSNRLLLTLANFLLLLIYMQYSFFRTFHSGRFSWDLVAAILYQNRLFLYFVVQHVSIEALPRFLLYFLGFSEEQAL